MSLLNPNPANKITCESIAGTIASLKALKFENYGLSVIQGASTLFHLAMNSFFMPVEQFQYGEFDLAASGSVMLDPGNISNANGEVTGIIVVVEYPSTDASNATITEPDKYVHYSYHTGPDLNIGKMLFLSGANTAGAGWNLLGSPGGMVITNPHTNFDVKLKVLLIS